MNNNSDFNVLVCRNILLDQQWRNAVKIRPHWRIYCNLSAGARIESRGQIYYPDADHIIAMPPGVSVDQFVESPFQHFYMHVAIGFPYHTYPEVVYFEIGDETKRLIQRLAGHFKEEVNFKNWSNHNKNLLNALIYRVICELDEEKLSGRRISNIIGKTLRVLEQSIVSGIANNELAKMAGLSLSAFLAKFNREVGCAPQQYLLQKRLERAVYLLSSSDESIEHIASQCGFCERSYLSRLFKREFNVSPAEYRRHSEV